MKMHEAITLAKQIDKDNKDTISDMKGKVEEAKQKIEELEEELVNAEETWQSLSQMLEDMEIEFS